MTDFSDDTSSFITFLLQKNTLQIEIKFPSTHKVEHKLRQSRLGYYNKESETYIIEVMESELSKKSKLINGLIERIYQSYQFQF